MSDSGLLDGLGRHTNPVAGEPDAAGLAVLNRDSRRVVGGTSTRSANVMHRELHDRTAVDRCIRVSHHTCNQVHRFNLNDARLTAEGSRVLSELDAHRDNRIALEQVSVQLSIWSAVWPVQAAYVEVGTGFTPEPLSRPSL
jgi:hypothetical protein